ncbi:MAG: pentapeptide repeat-containing protein [Fischerella sp. CENA71]|nr:pentapeptide repeat-containing protein [Fischerella sp. CENA71]
MFQDFSGQNLRGRSFKNQNLERAIFSGADIRGADFTAANLKGAFFNGATAGLPKHREVFLKIILLLLSFLGGFTAAFPGIWITDFFFIKKNYYYSIIPGVLALIIIASLSFTIDKKGLGFAVVSVSIIGTLVGAIIGTFLAIWLKAQDSLGALSVGVAGAITAIELGFIVVIVTVATSLTIKDKKTVIATVVAAPTTAVMAAVLATPKSVAFGGITVALIVAAIAALLIDYLARSIIKNEQQNVFFRNFLVSFITKGGTSFRKANLTDADFRNANLERSDFRDAILIRTCFKQVKMLICVRPGKTYLQKSQMRQVLVTGQGQEKNFDREDLRGVNFQGANLVDASFIGADLSQANLQDADLTRAKLVQTQLNGTDLTGATLTGAYIQDWGITTDTKFDGVRCEYVYMRLPTTDNPDPYRKPDNRQEVFADGEFGDFIKPIFDTLDLYHNQGVDPRAIAISFKQLAENHPEADLRIVGMEVRGEDKFLLRAKTAAKADKSQLSAEYFEIYHQIKALAEQELKALIAEKDDRIRSLENFVTQALQRPNFYSSTQIQEVGTMNPNQGGINQSVNNSQIGGGMQAAQGNNNQQNMSNETYRTKYDQSHANIGGFVDTAQSGSQQIFNQNISQSEQKQTLAEAAAEIQALLEQLSQSYPTETMSGKMALAAEATQRIENNPTLMHKTISALRAGGTAALEQALSHPAASFVIAALDDWNKNNQ